MTIGGWLHWFTKPSARVSRLWVPRRNGAQAVNAVLTLDPDVLVTDISMPVLGGLEAASQLQRAGCRAKVIFLTANNGQEFIDAAFSAGASGYVNKTRLSTDLIPAIQQAMSGDGRWLTPNAVGNFQTNFRNQPQNKPLIDRKHTTNPVS